ncbi:molecular chaperone DnaJ [Oceanibaculum pacificum]|uniref:Chaperone protein DnaJ n=1 Tax=Oceanibaculum pacificum TaxID=580166 RepID=A0A154WGZ4_9PROT|nr:molecular chaperone DnaJ [Oceanibaculum pacificum]KZD12780.1 molecular chaperone DnaJ [Oceanibaculum pacificum]
MAKRDYYQTLGVEKGADKEALKRAYRKLAMQYHPDRNPDDPEAEAKFKEVNEAYDVLKDDEKRAAYDRFGHAAFENGGGPRRPGGPGGGDFGFGGGFADIFDEMFGEFMGGARRGQQRGRGADLRLNLEIELEDAFNGATKEIRIPSSMSCEACDGSGAEKGSQPVTCGTCGGAGKVRAQQGFFTIERTCPTCGGVGKVIEKPCRVCGGAGRQQKDKTLSVSIPAGVEDGTRIRLAGEGEAGLRGAASGDLYIFLSIAPHRFFQREGSDIHCRVPIPMTKAALGGSIEVPTLEGRRVKVTIPEGTQAGHQFRLRGKGMTVYQSSLRGDLYVEVTVETPVNLTKQQRELLRQFEEQGGTGEVTSPESAGFFAKVKELWEDLRD